MTIRAFTPSDCQQIADLFYTTVHTINAADYNAAQLDAWASTDKTADWWILRLKSLHTAVAETDSVIIGFGSMDNAGYFDLLYVHKDYQRMGVATMIADALETYAAEKGVAAITTDASITARPFMERRGYAVIQEQTVETNGQKLVNYKMQKTR